MNLVNGNRATEAGKISNQPGKDFCIGPTSLNREIYCSMLIYYTFKKLCSQLNEARDIPYADKARLEEAIDYYVLPQLARFKEIIDKGIE